MLTLMLMFILCLMFSQLGATPTPVGWVLRDFQPGFVAHFRKPFARFP